MILETCLQLYRDYNYSHLLINRTNKQKICSVIDDFVRIQPNWPDICRTFDQTPAENKIFSSAHGTLTKIDCIFWDRNNSSKLFKNWNNKNMAVAMDLN